MDVNFKILGSSSSGNSSLLQVGDTKILIDAGLSAKKIQALLSKLNIAIDELDAVFLTHEHNDHTAGISLENNEVDNNNLKKMDQSGINK